MPKAHNALHPLYRLFRKDWDRDNAELRSFYLQAPPGPSATGCSQRVVTLASVARAWALALPHLLLLDPRFERFARKWSALMADVRKPERVERSPLELLAEYRHVWQRVSNWWGITLVNYQNMIFFSAQAQRLLRRYKLADDERLLSDLLCGDEQLLGVEIVLSVVRLDQRCEPRGRQCVTDQRFERPDGDGCSSAQIQRKRLRSSEFAGNMKVFPASSGRQKGVNRGVDAFERFFLCSDPAEIA